MALIPITKAACPNTRAGIRKIWVTLCASVTALTFATNGAVSAITMASGKFFTPIEFELNTAFFNQEKKRAGGKGAPTVTQLIEFLNEGITQDILNALGALNEEGCCLHCIVKMNTGKLFYAGISRDGTGFISEEMRTGDGYANSGTNPENDSSGTKESLTCKTTWYAPECTVLESAIPIS